MGFNLVQSAERERERERERESSEDRTTPLELFSEVWAYDFILMLVKNFILSKLSAYVFLSTSISKVPLLSLLTETGLTIPEMTLCTTNGFILVRCLSSKDSRTTKRGKDEIEVSLSESLSVAWIFLRKP